jgi:hypothetical protein
MLQHRVDAGLNPRLESLVLGFEVDEGYCHDDFFLLEINKVYCNNGAMILKNFTNLTHLKFENLAVTSAQTRQSTTLELCKKYK